jgi:hypothetical protein
VSLQLQLAVAFACVVAVILSAAKDPEALRLTHTARTFSPNHSSTAVRNGQQI